MSMTSQACYDTSEVKKEMEFTSYGEAWLFVQDAKKRMCGDLNFESCVKDFKIYQMWEVGK